LLTVALLWLKVTTVLTPLSAMTVTAPPSAVASARVAPLATPVPRVRAGTNGAVVSMTMLGSNTCKATGAMFGSEAVPSYISLGAPAPNMKV
jgi:hypothetical protein